VLISRGVNEMVADAASVGLMENPPQFLDGHIKAFMKVVKEVWQRSEVPVDAPSEREAAERLSKHCDDCRGVGITTRFRRHSRGVTDANGKPRSDAVQFYCRCAMGRWVEQSHRLNAKDIRRRFYDLEDHAWLWGDEYRYPADAPTWVGQQETVESTA
jgi:hypothetical protein